MWVRKSAKGIRSAYVLIFDDQVPPYICRAHVWIFLCIGFCFNPTKIYIEFTVYTVHIESYFSSTMGRPDNWVF
jgi:hypothetical protein